ncbi:MAG TPA: hypothetical protein VFF06_03880 [Polyangia bacterium]|nr:hypothetical protein [Polyangia bacterium]
MTTVGERIEARTRQYGNLPLFRAFREDRIPPARFPEFFKEQYMAARWFQDLIWATTEISDGPYAEFAAEHRRRDSGHYRWMKHDLEKFGQPPMTDDDFFRLEWLPTRIQMARMLARCHDATPEDKMVMLGALESAGEVTLTTLNGYVARHGFGERTLYLGEPHIAVEQRQADRIKALMAHVMRSADERHLATVDLVFDSLTTMFGAGGRRYYAEHLSEDGRVTCADVRREVRALAAFHGLDAAAVEEALEDVAPHLYAYAEIVLAERGFELITGGRGRAAAESLAAIASRHGAPAAVCAAFLDCERAFPGELLGLKLAFDANVKPISPSGTKVKPISLSAEKVKPISLYVRTQAPLDEGLAFLGRLPSLAPAVPLLARALEENRVLYGLGFFAAEGGGLGVKTYTIGDVPLPDGGHAPGFLSRRIAAGRVIAEVKRYLPDVDWSRLEVPSDRWRALVDFAGGELGYRRAGHFGIVEREHGAPELKLYVERIGAIPTDFAAR